MQRLWVKYLAKESGLVNHSEQSIPVIFDNKPVCTEVETQRIKTLGQCWLNVGQCLRRWPDIETTLINYCVCSTVIAINQLYTCNVYQTRGVRQCWYDIGPASTTLGQQCNSTGFTSRFFRSTITLPFTGLGKNATKTRQELSSDYDYTRHPYVLAPASLVSNKNNIVRNTVWSLILGSAK